MFTGFASENTPAIQVWNFFRDCAQGPKISLPDDCAPIQLIKTGGSSTAIELYLPSCPIEGAQIKICNLMFGSNSQKIQIRSPDVSGTGSSSIIFTLGPACNLDLIYSKDFISNGVTGGTVIQTGWVALNISPRTAYNYGSIVVGSDNSSAYENSAAIFGGSGHLVGASNGVVVGGANNNVFGFRGSVVGGTGNNGNGQYSGVFGGQSNTASNTNAAIVGGTSNTADSTNGIVSGGAQGTTRSIIGNAVLPASNVPISSAAGVTQSALLILGRQTTDATATVLRSNTSAATTTNQVILPNNSAYYFRGECIAGVTGAGDTKGWYLEGVIKRGAGVGTTAIVGTATVTSNYADAGAATWAVTATADTTNGGLAITVTGQAATTIRWVCQIRTTEMTY